MNGASKILVAYVAGIGLSALICAPAGAQPSNLAQVTQPGVNMDHSETGSAIARPLSEPTVTSPNPASGVNPRRQFRSPHVPCCRGTGHSMARTMCGCRRRPGCATFRLRNSCKAATSGATGHMSGCPRIIQTSEKKRVWAFACMTAPLAELPTSASRTL